MTKLRTHDLADTLAFHIRAEQLPEPVREYKFLHDRKYRFDLAWIEKKIGVEVDGGIWPDKYGQLGRHLTGKGVETDCEKFSLAALNGWRVFRFTRKMVEEGRAVSMLKITLGG